MKMLGILVALMLLSYFPTCRTFYNVSCVPESFKGISVEVWFGNNIKSLEDLKVSTNAGVPASQTLHIEQNYFSVFLKPSGKTAGIRIRTFYLCSLTGIYEFYFSCFGACEWFIKESDDKEVNITGGSSRQGMEQDEFITAIQPVNLTEGNTYYIEILRFQPEGEEGHFRLRVIGPGDNRSISVPWEHLVAYQQNGSYGTLHPGEWEDWSPCSTPCGPDGRHSRNRSCLIYPTIFNYSTDGYELTESQECNIDVFPCVHDSCRAYPIILGNDNVTRFSLPLDVASTVPGDHTWEQPHPDDDAPEWCFNESAASYLELNFTVTHRICAIKTQGVQTSNNETKFASTYVIEVFEVSDNCSSWKFYNGSGNRTVFVSNSYDDPLSSKVNYLTDGNITASLIRIWLMPSNDSCIRLKVYGEPIGSGATQTVRVFSPNATSLLIRWGDLKPYFLSDAVDGYEITITNLSGETTKINVSILANEIEVSGLEKYSQYCMTVKALTGEGYGSESDEVCAFTAEDAPSAPPANILATSTAFDTIIISWGEVPMQEQNGIVRKYKVHVTNSGQTLEHMSTVDADVASLIVSNLVHNTYYCVQLTAFTVADGPLSACVNVTTLEKVLTCQDALGMESGAISDAQITASSQLSGYTAANHSRLRFQETGMKAGGWSAATNNSHQWLQIDLGSHDYRVTRVGSQGRHSTIFQQWVTKYKLQYSNHAVTFWYFREQGMTTDKEFAGNEDNKTVVSHDLNPPIKARYIRFVPVAWHDWISMRVELYGCTVCSTEWTQYGSHCYKAFQVEVSWDAARHDCLDLNSDLVSIPNSAENSFIAAAFLPGKKDTAWIGLNDKEKEDEFHWSDGTPYNFSIFSKADIFNGRKANCVFINNGEWFEHSCSNKRPYICKKRGFKTLPCENEAIGKGRLNDGNVWCANLGLPSYLQVDLNSTYVICALATQGNSSSFVEEYKVEFSSDGSGWEFYRGLTDVKNFTGNSDNYTMQKNIFAERVCARYVRIWPTKWSQAPCMRIELYGYVPFAEIASPPVITDIKFYSIGMHSFDISWESRDACQSTKKVTGYKIVYQRLTQLRVLDEKNVTITAGKNITNYTIAGLERNQTYCVRILAYNENGDGHLSDCAEVKTATDCLPEWILFQTNCYLLIDERPQNWYHAQIDCLNRNSDLLYILNTKEEEFIDSQIINKSAIRKVFIGLREDENSITRFVKWSSGNDLEYTNWYASPAEGVSSGTACVAKNTSVYGQWEIVDCLQTMSYICKKKGFYLSDSYCWKKAIGLETGEVPDINITASSYIDSNPPSAARLGLHGGWCPLNESSAFLQIDLGVPYRLSAVATQGRSDGSFVKRYAIMLSLDGGSWTEFEKKFNAATNYYRAKQNYLNSDVVAQFVRFYPETWHQTPCMRVEIFGKPAEPFPPPTKSPKIQEARGIDSTSIQFDLIPPRPYYAAYNITGYNIRCWKNETNASSQIKTFPSDTVTVHLTGLDAYTVYCLSAAAFNSYGTGYYSPCTTAMTNESVPDEPPANVTAQAASSSSVTVSWNPVPPGHENGVIIGYRVLYVDERETRPKLNSTLLANIFVYEVTGLMPFSNYCIQVLGFTRQGDGNVSDCLITSTAEGVPSSSPVNITVRTTNSTSLSVSWNPVPLGFENGVISGYKVFYVDQANSVAKLHINVSSVTLSVELDGLLVYTYYCIQVLAFTREGDGTLSDCTVASTTEGVPSAVPINLSAFRSDYRTVILSWDPVPKRHVNGELLGYGVILNGSETILFVAPCFSSLKLSDVNISRDTCIRMAAVTKVGFGPMTNCTQIDFVLDTSSPKTAATTAMSLTKIKVTWEHGMREGLKGDLDGFYIKYQAIRVGGEPIVDLLAQPNYTVIVCASVNEVLLTNLTTYTMYKIQVAVTTFNGIGNFSDPIYGETCRCTEHLSVSLVQSPLDSSGFTSLASVITDLLTATCGACEEHNDTKLVSTDSGVEEKISFPVTKTQAFGDTEYSKFIPVIKVPGILVIGKKGTDRGLLTKVMANSIFHSWPVFLLAMLTALLAGIIIWILDSSSNPEQFPRTFFKGAGEGFWWSVITFSTVGYGDRCPQSIPAKVFAMVWFLIGLVIFSLFIGSLTSVLTVTVVSMDLYGGSATNPIDGKIAVVTNSSEHQMVVKNFRNKIDIGSTFPDVNSMVRALQSGNISSVLLEMYLPVKRKDLFNNSWFEVRELLQVEITHGVLLQGAGVSKLAKEMKNLILTDNIQTKYLTQQNDVVDQTDVDSSSVVFFEPSSPYFLNTLLISIALLFFAVLCGLFYQSVCYKRLCREPVLQGTCRCGVMKRDITESVEKFYHDFSKTYHRLRQKYKIKLANHVTTRDTCTEEAMKKTLTYTP